MPCHQEWTCMPLFPPTQWQSDWAFPSHIPSWSSPVPTCSSSQSVFCRWSDLSSSTFRCLFRLAHTYWTISWFRLCNLPTSLHTDPSHHRSRSGSSQRGHFSLHVCRKLRTKLCSPHSAWRCSSGPWPSGVQGSRVWNLLLDMRICEAEA